MESFPAFKKAENTPGIIVDSANNMASITIPGLGEKLVRELHTTQIPGYVILTGKSINDLGEIVDTEIKLHLDDTQEQPDIMQVTMGSEVVYEVTKH